MTKVECGILFKIVVYLVMLFFLKRVSITVSEEMTSHGSAWVLMGSILLRGEV